MKHINKILAIVFLGILTSNAQNKVNAQGKKEGKWTGYYENTNNLRYEGSFMNGQEQGVFTFYADEPKKKIIATRDFSKGGGNAYTVYFENGKKTSEGNYKNKKKEGKWQFFHKGGEKLMSEEYYINDQIEGVKKVYYPSGKISEEIVYKNGMQNGYSYQYAENGVKLREENYKDGVQHGKAIYRDINGKIIREGEYKNGIKIGNWANDKQQEVVPVSKAKNKKQIKK